MKPNSQQNKKTYKESVNRLNAFQSQEQDFEKIRNIFIKPAEEQKQETQTIHNMWENMLTQEDPMPQAAQETQPTPFSAEGAIYFAKPEEPKKTGVYEEIAVDEANIYQQEIPEPQKEIQPQLPKHKFSPTFSQIIGESFGFIFSPKSIESGKKNTKEFATAIKVLFLEYIVGFGEKKKSQETRGGKEKKHGFMSNNWFSKAFIGIDRRKYLGTQREDINKKLKMGNVSFEDTVKESGEMRIDIQTLFSKTNSELQQEQIKMKKKQQLKAAMQKNSKRKPGVIFDLNKAAESMNSVLKIHG